MAPEWARMSGAKTALVAFAAGIAALVCLVRFGLSARGLIDGFVAAVLVVLAVIDFRRRILPNVIVLPAAGIVYLAQVTFFPHHALQWTVCSLGCAAFFLATLLAYPPGLGMGDVKLGLLLGAALGKSVIAALLFGFFGAAIVGVAMMVTQGAQARKKAIPLGPFLAGGALIILFFG